MKKTLYGVIALPLLMGIGMAQQSWAAQLSDAQMDKVTAGFDFSETDNANTSWTQVSLYAGPLTPCAQRMFPSHQQSRPEYRVKVRAGCAVAPVNV